MRILGYVSMQCLSMYTVMEQVSTKMKNNVIRVCLEIDIVDMIECPIIMSSELSIQCKKQLC